MQTEAAKPLNNNDALMLAGSRLRILSLRTGKQHPVLQAMAVRQALLQARLGVMGHQMWKRRSIELGVTMPKAYGFMEAVAYAQAGRDLAAKMIFDEWKRSAPHWAIVNRRCDFYGYAMAQGRKGVWYACGLTALKR